MKVGMNVENPTRNMGMRSKKVRFNVGGKIFETTETTLASVSRNSTFGAMLDYEFSLQSEDINKECFIDRKPDCFSVLLDLLRTGELFVPPHIPDKLFYREAIYYGLLDQVRTAKFCRLDSNRLKLISTARGQSSGNCRAIRASPDGGCAVAHGSIVRVYDWMLEEHPPLNIDYKEVSDIEWIDSDNILMSVCQGKKSSTEVGGMGVFSSSTGELRHRFLLNDGKDHIKGFSAGALCSNSDGKIFASCRGTSSSGIGVWDQETGKQIDFYVSSNGLHLDNATFQWLRRSDFLFVSCFKSGIGIFRKHCINLLDFRDKSTVWCSQNYSRVVDAIAMEESNSICLLSMNEDLGFVDLRSTKKDVRWNSKRRLDDCVNRYPKLRVHEGRIFCSMYDKISVYCGGPDEWVLTSDLERSTQGGSIRDFSIGGDRLFALHSEENVFDVWETPSAPII